MAWTSAAKTRINQLVQEFAQTRTCPPVAMMAGEVRLYNNNQLGFDWHDGKGEQRLSPGDSCTLSVRRRGADVRAFTIFYDKDGWLPVDVKVVFE